MFLMDFLVKFSPIMVKYYIKTTLRPNEIENDRTNYSEKCSQYAYLVDPSARPDLAIFPFLSEPNCFAGHNYVPKHL